jgi:alcohol dehydrogenase
MVAMADAPAVRRWLSLHFRRRFQGQQPQAAAPGGARARPAWHGTTVRALQFDAYGQPPSVRDVPDPQAPPGGVVVRVGATGVCRSDWHAWQGHELVALPHIPGHELAGTVAQVGDGVTRWQVGDRVTAPFVCGCGRCDYCLAGDAQICPNQTQPGFTGPGSMAELVVLHAADTNLVALPDGVDMVSAASLGCRFATAYRALVGRARLSDGEWLAVHGCGGVGLSAVMIGVALGARVVAVDVSPDALALARELGAEHVVDATGLDDASVAVKDAIGGGAHVSVDALGSPATAVASVRCLRRRGRHVQVGLLLGQESTPPIPMDQVLAKELDIYGSHGMAARDYPGMLELVARGRVAPRRLVGSVIGLDEAGEALAAMSRPARQAGMTVIVFDP